MKQTLRLAIPMMLFAFFAAFVRAQNAAMPEEKATITGTVLDAVSQRPLKGADVRLRSLPTDSGTASVSRSGSTSTDADGRFVFNGVTPGRYVVLASRDGYVSNRGDNFRLRGVLSVAPGQHVNAIVVRLLPESVGRLLSLTSAPLSGR